MSRPHDLSQIHNCRQSRPAWPHSGSQRTAHSHRPANAPDVTVVRLGLCVTPISAVHALMSLNASCDALFRVRSQSPEWDAAKSAQYHSLDCSQIHEGALRPAAAQPFDLGVILEALQS
ncbi:hypothetical protein PBRA_005029 [Plasmodiophora brassicae]|uniref:Uncharacterized protein n=1 Tax=Plasmodiophora brassicae TaxID=37360 RepID=A0A0G4IMF9_PLABS|nr:hypothetical protein PBRA_005029 [Plasmodiophora brassicae]